MGGCSSTTEGKYEDKHDNTETQKYVGPLTPEEIHLLQTSWNDGVQADAQQKAGLVMFVHLFKQYPEVEDIFSNFVGLVSNAVTAQKKQNVDILETLQGTDEEGYKNLAAHGLVVMMLFHKIITNLDKPGVISQLIARTAHTHRFFAGFESKHFLLMEEPFLIAVKGAIGEEKFNEELHTVYKKAISWLLHALKEHNDGNKVVS